MIASAENGMAPGTFAYDSGKMGVPLSQLNAEMVKLVTIRAMANEHRKLERLARIQASVSDEQSRLALLQVAEQWRRYADQRQDDQFELDPFPEGWWASP